MEIIGNLKINARSFTFLNKKTFALQAFWVLMYIWSFYIYDERAAVWLRNN